MRRYRRGGGCRPEPPVRALRVPLAIIQSAVCAAGAGGCAPVGRLPAGGRRTAAASAAAAAAAAAAVDGRRLLVSGRRAAAAAGVSGGRGPRREWAAARRGAPSGCG